MKRIDDRLLRGWPLPHVGRGGSKDQRGKILVIGGSAEVPGGALLAAVAALRAGAGKLQVATSRSVAVAIGVAVPEARVIALPQDRRGQPPSASATRIRREIEEADAVLVGPGMMGTAAGGILKRALAFDSEATFIADAAALPAFQRLRVHGRPVVLTPNGGEMAAITGKERDEVEADPERFARQIAETTGAVVVCKCSPTVIAAPDGRIFYRPAANAGLGTSGSGDTLSGVIAGFAARGADPVQAAVWGVQIHSTAGDVLARRVAPLGFLARELLHEIPRAVARLSPKASPRRTSSARR